MTSAVARGGRIRRLTLEKYVLSQSFRVAMQELAAGDFRFILAMGDDGYDIVKPPPDGMTWPAMRTTREDPRTKHAQRLDTVPTLDSD